MGAFSGISKVSSKNNKNYFALGQHRAAITKIAFKYGTGKNKGQKVLHRRLQDAG